MTASGRCARNFDVAVPRFSASTISNPAPARNFRTAIRMMLSSSTRSTRLRVRSVISSSCFPYGQAYANHRAAGDVAGNDVSRMLFDDTLHDRQSQTRPALAFREEGLERAIEGLRIEARPIVFDRAFDPVAARVLDLGNANGHDAVLRRMLDGVVDEILENLTQPHAVHQQRRERLRNDGVHRDRQVARTAPVDGILQDVRKAAL